MTVKEKRSQKKKEPKDTEKRKLYRNSRWKCAYAGCEKEAYDEIDTWLMRVAHIRSEAEGGPRYDPTYIGDFNAVDNLILFCQDHHIRVDNSPDIYPIEKLLEMKKNHEMNIPEWDGWYQVIDLVRSRPKDFEQHLKDQIVKDIEVLMKEDSKYKPNNNKVKNSWNAIKRDAKYDHSKILEERVERLIKRSLG